MTICPTCLEPDAPEILYSEIFFGHVQSKANSRIATRSGRWIKSRPAQKFVSGFIAQTFHPMGRVLPEFVRNYGNLLVRGIDFPVTLVCTIYYPSRRNDLDESLVMDCLQKAGIIRNDRLIKKKIIHWGIDKYKPRVELELRRYHGQEKEENAAAKVLKTGDPAPQGGR